VESLDRSGLPAVRHPSMRFVFLPFSLVLLACSSSSAPQGSPDAGHPDARVSQEAGVADAPVMVKDSSTSTGSDAAPDALADVNKAATCATTFGESLTNAFGRLDGTVLAIVPPNDQTCAMPNMTHLVIQVTMSGAAYRMVVDVLSDSGDPNVSFYELDAPLEDGAWAEGWHAGVNLDYVTTLKVHSPSFTSMTQATLVTKVTSEIVLGSKISVFATSMDEPDSAHLVHRNLTNEDGAIVVGPDTKTPHYLLFRFAEQTF
jgi:hypothetical protein